MKMYLGSEGIAARILNLSTRRRWVVSFTFQPFYPGKRNPYPLDRRLGWPQSQSERSGRKKPRSWRESNPGRPARIL